MKDVVVEVKVRTLLVITSVIVIRYSTMTPLISLATGGFHDRVMEVELAGVSTTFRGGLVGARK